jgi:glycosyltransferase involved in cell wall biosynthesis
MRFGLSLIHSTDFIPPLRSSVPSVITVHDLAFLHYPHFLTASSAAYYGQIDRAIRSARAVIVPSESTKRDVMAMLGVPANKISVIYEAAAESFTPLPLDEATAYVKRHYNLPASYMLVVGTIEPRKNITGLLQAFHILRTQYNVRDTTLAIAGGKGWLYDETLETIDKLGLRSSVRLLDRVSDEALHQLYVAARCNVHPALYEGFGLPPLEAMACGTPTIVSNVSSLPEVVQDAALLIDPEDPEDLAIAMNRLLADDALHAELREKGLARAACFSWHRAAQATYEVYRRVADRQSVASRAGGAPAAS